MWRSVIDYQTLIAEAVRSLDGSTEKARRILYERARAAQMRELRAVHPPLSEAAIAKERLTLENAISKVETDVSRGARTKSPETRPPPRPNAVRLEQHAKERPKDGPVAFKETQLSPSAVLPAEQLSDQSIPNGGCGDDQTKSAKGRGAKALPAVGARSPREARSARYTPSAGDEFDQFQEELALSRPYGKIIGGLITLLILAGFAGILTWQWPRLTVLYSDLSSLVVKQQSKQKVLQTAPSTKFSDRVQQKVETAVPTRDSQASPSIAQRVLLYEEDSSGAQGKRYFGLVTWQTEIIPPSSSSTSDIAVRANIKIPERQTTVTWLLRRNANHAPGASHIVEIVFDLPAGFAGSGIASVPGIMAKQSEEMPGKPLAKLGVKASDGVYTIELPVADVQHNVQLLKESSWFDIPIVYVNGTRAIMAIEKGSPGSRAFADAFAAWDRN